MHTLSYSQAEMETLLTKVLSHTCKQQLLSPSSNNIS